MHGQTPRSRHVPSEGRTAPTFVEDIMNVWKPIAILATAGLVASLGIGAASANKNPAARRCPSRADRVMVSPTWPRPWGA